MKTWGKKNGVPPKSTPKKSKRNYEHNHRPCLFFYTRGISHTVVMHPHFHFEQINGENHE